MKNKEKQETIKTTNLMNMLTHSINNILQVIYAMILLMLYSKLPIVLLIDIKIIAKTENNLSFEYLLQQYKNLKNQKWLYSVVMFLITISFIISVYGINSAFLKITVADSALFLLMLTATIAGLTAIMFGMLQLWTNRMNEIYQLMLEAQYAADRDYYENLKKKLHESQKSEL